MSTNSAFKPPAKKTRTVAPARFVSMASAPSLSVIATKTVEWASCAGNSVVSSNALQFMRLVQR